jgi:hypothetical protein
MLLLLSPAKKLDYRTAVPPALQRKATEPRYAHRAAELVAVLGQQTPAQVATLMRLSDPLAALTVARCAAWEPAATPANSKPALLAFAGDVYRGLAAGTLAAADLAWAQEHLVILSGLYGALRPLDRLQPYRLEMGTPLRTARGKDLYAYWGNTVAAYLNERLAGQAGPAVVNLASVEYARVVLGKAAQPGLRARVVECVFEDWQDGRWRVVAFHAKRARGLMARHAVLQRARSLRQLESFAAEGYAYEPAASGPDRLVFRRRR